MCLLFFVYNTVGEIYSINYSFIQKRNKIYEILNTPEVVDMFKNIDIFKLNVSTKLKIITFVYKYRMGLNLLIRYFSR